MPRLSLAPQRVRFSDQYGDDSAAAELNGFLGTGGSQIELPFSKLSLTTNGSDQTMMTDDELGSMREVGEEMQPVFKLSRGPPLVVCNNMVAVD